MSRPAKFCSVNGCYEKHYAKGLCTYHYGRRRAGDIEGASSPRSFPSCETCGTALPRKDARWCGPKCQPVTFNLDAWVNPFTCVCDEPQADPAIDFGMCQVCKRPHLSCFRILRGAA